MTLTEFRNIWQPQINAQLRSQLKQSIELNRVLAPIEYAVMGGGKRLRPLLTVAVIKSFGLDPKPYLQAVDAVELIHAYSLIHDDLPAMDNDQFRRGQATTHVAFDEASAILAGDALQPLAFDWLSQAKDLSEHQRLALIAALADASGGRGMVAGQVFDMAYTGQTEITLDQAQAVQRAKTGALIVYALKAGGIMSQADEAQLTALKHYGAAFGLAFQIKDDLDDWQQDGREDKQAYPNILGLDGAAKMLAKQVHQAQIALTDLTNTGVDPDLLTAFLNYFEPLKR